jgi:hypothetical protein
MVGRAVAVKAYCPLMYRLVRNVSFRLKENYSSCTVNSRLLMCPQRELVGMKKRAGISRRNKQPQTIPFAVFVDELGLLLDISLLT